MRYGAGPEVLSDVTFALKPGSFHFVTGPSGAGKSSLLKLMYLAHRPSRGFVTLFDRDVTRVPRSDLPELRRRRPVRRLLRELRGNLFAARPQRRSFDGVGHAADGARVRARIL